MFLILLTWIVFLRFPLYKYIGTNISISSWHVSRKGLNQIYKVINNRHKYVKDIICTVYNDLNNKHRYNDIATRYNYRYSDLNNKHTFHFHFNVERYIF